MFMDFGDDFDLVKFGLSLGLLSSILFISDSTQM
jgi:hypothetical protein